MATPENTPTPPKPRGRTARFANIFLPVTEVASAARSARSMGASISGAVGAVASRVRAVLRKEEEPQPTVVDEGLARDSARVVLALRFARVRWSAGVLAMLAGVYQLGGAIFTPAGVLAVVNFVLSAVLLGLFGLWLAMVAARDAAVLQGQPGTSNLEVLKTPNLWLPW